MLAAKYQTKILFILKLKGEKKKKARTLLNLSLYAVKYQTGQEPSRALSCRSPPGLLYALWC